MRGFAFFLAFISGLPFILMSPFNGVLAWYAFSLGNFHTMTWGFFSNLNYAYILAIVTCISWLFSRTEPKRLPLTPVAVLTLLLSAWMTLTSFFALAPSDDVWGKWEFVHKMLFMCLVGYALTTTRERVNLLIWAVLLTIGIWGVKGAVMSPFHGFGTIHGPDGGMDAPNNEFGLALIMILPLAFYQWQLATNRYLRRGLMVMGFLLAFAVILTYSRGALIGVCAMGVVFWFRSRAKVAAALLIIMVGLTVYNFAPRQWFERMGTIESYDADASAMSRLWIWQISLQIAAQRPLFGGGFRVTMWPSATNPLLEGTDLTRMSGPKAAHSNYFDMLSEHGWIGLALYLMILAYSWRNCSWLMRRSRDRQDLAWANILGRMGQAVLVGFGVGGAFQSLAYFDGFWGVLFIFEAARRLVAKEIATPASAPAITPSMPLPPPVPGIVGAASSGIRR